MHQAVKAFLDLLAHGDFIRADIIDHQRRDVIDISFDIINISDQVQQFQHADVILLDAVVIVSGGLAAVNHAADSAFQKGMHRVVEEAERYKGVFILVLDGLRSLLEA